MQHKAELVFLLSPDVVFKRKVNRWRKIFVLVQ